MATSRSAEFGASPGPGVDAQGRPVVDPTANVINILEAAVQRLDDLRGSEVKALRREAELRARYEHQLRKAEAKRIDAIRQVDVAAVQQAALVQTTQANTLATQVVASAEALRNQVSAAAVAQTEALTNALQPMQKSIDDLRQAQYQAQGEKAQVVDSRSSNGFAVAAIGLGISLVIAIAGVVMFVAGQDSPTPDPIVVEVPANGG